MKAVKRFDPAKGVRLVSFAVHWIKAEMHEYILRNWRIVKVATTKAQRKLFFNLRSQKKALGWLSAEETRAIAADFGVDEAEVTEWRADLPVGMWLTTRLPSVMMKRVGRRPSTSLTDTQVDPEPAG